MFNFSQVRWLRVILAAVSIPVLVFLFGTLVVTAYAFQLAFAARGAPDQIAIAQFAQTTVPLLSPWLSALTALLVTWLVTRSLGAAAMTNAIAIGIATGLLLFGLEALRGNFVAALVDLIAPLIGSLFAGWLNQRRVRAQSAL